MFFSNETISKIYDTSAIFFFGAAVFAITSDRVILAAVFLAAVAALGVAARAIKKIDRQEPGNAESCDATSEMTIAEPVPEEGGSAGEPEDLC